MGFLQIVIAVPLNKVFMQTARRFSLNSASKMKNKYASREAKFFNKLINSSKPKRKLYFENAPVSPVSGRLNLSKITSSNKENSRRVAVLNTIFMKQISDLLVSSSIPGNVLDKGLQISRVSMAPDMSHLNIFWAANCPENARVLEAVLPDLGFSLRHELSQLRVMGTVPRIIFVKDKSYYNALKIDHLISIADYGEDHKPLPYGSEFINQPVVEKKLTKTPAENTEDSECGETSTVAETEETIPEMRHNVFNLDHKYIMEKIMKSVQKSRAMHRYQPNLAVDCKGKTNDSCSDTADVLSKEERKAAMAKFILNRKILEEKRRQNKYNSELNVLPLDVNENDVDNDYEDFTIEDYIEEDYPEKEKTL